MKASRTPTGSRTDSHTLFAATFRSYGAPLPCDTNKSVEGSMRMATGLRSNHALICEEGSMRTQPSG